MPTSWVALLVLSRSHVRSRVDLQLENLALRHQIGGLQRSLKKPREITAMDRLFWASPSRIWRDWRSALVIVTPQTVAAVHGLSLVLDLEGSAGTARTPRDCHSSRGSGVTPTLGPLSVRTCFPNANNSSSHIWRRRSRNFCKWTSLDSNARRCGPLKSRSGLDRRARTRRAPTQVRLRVHNPNLQRQGMWCLVVCAPEEIVGSVRHECLVTHIGEGQATGSGIRGSRTPFGV